MMARTPDEGVWPSDAIELATRSVPSKDHPSTACNNPRDRTVNI
jgi:hypothetical protein